MPLVFMVYNERVEYKARRGALESRHAESCDNKPRLTINAIFILERGHFRKSVWTYKIPLIQEMRAI